ncbi:hypothetical protein BDZ89DRAFT_1043454 [Hymenopellis radicata]|nr:hypothetical protein BDZ89DRAFT_1043454 [Hymenopellis radicata]
MKVFPQAFQDDASKSQSSTSRQITVPAPRWLGLGGDGEGGQRPPFNTRLNRKRASRVGDGGRGGRGVEADEDPSQVELNTVLSQDGVQLFKASLISISVFQLLEELKLSKKYFKLLSINYDKKISSFKLKTKIKNQMDWNFIA